MLLYYVPSLLGTLAGEKSFLNHLMSIISYPLAFILGPFSMLYNFSIYKELKRVKKDPVTLPKRTPYIVIPLLGYLLCAAFTAFLLFVIVPRVSEYLKQRAASQRSTDKRSRMYLQPTSKVTTVNNIKRLADLNTLMNGVKQFEADTGELPDGISRRPKYISKTGLDICSLIIPAYLPQLPVDPDVNKGRPVTDCKTNYDTGYEIAVHTNGTITIIAIHADQQEDVSISW
jgi:hypothetical protein